MAGGLWHLKSREFRAFFAAVEGGNVQPAAVASKIPEGFQELVERSCKRGKRAGGGFPKTRMSDSIWGCCPESTSTIYRRRI